MCPALGCCPAPLLVLFRLCQTRAPRVGPGLKSKSGPHPAEGRAVRRAKHYLNTRSSAASFMLLSHWMASFDTISAWLVSRYFGLLAWGTVAEPVGWRSLFLYQMMFPKKFTGHGHGRTKIRKVNETIQAT